MWRDDRPRRQSPTLIDEHLFGDLNALVDQTIPGEPSKRFRVTHDSEVVGEFDTAAEVRAFTAKRLDRKYEIYDRRQRVVLKDLRD